MTRHPLSATVFVALILLVAVNAKLITISNKAVTVGISTEHGGAISTFIDNNVPDVNLINEHDQGREVQQSYYAGPDPYRNAHWGGHPWAWNPISSGDAFGHSGDVLRTVANESSIYLKSQPLQWALDKCFCNCTFETYLTVDDNGVYVRNRLVTFRADKKDYGERDQELPAVYTIGRMSHLWAGNDKGYEKVSYPVPGPPWERFSANASWAAFTDGQPQKYGVGVAHYGRTTFLGGFAGTPSPSAKSSDNPTGYIAPIDRWNIAADGTYTYCFRLALGYLDTIRDYFLEPSRQLEECVFPDV